MRPVLLFAVPFVCLLGCSETPVTTQNSKISASDSINRPERFVGIWLWWWSDGPAYHLVLHADGRAEKLSGFDPSFTNGSWQLDQDGFLEVRFAKPEASMRFRVDSDTEMMDVATIPTDRDFPWQKADRIVATLADTLPNEK